MSETGKQIEEASSIIRKIKVKNDSLSKLPYSEQRIQSEITRDKEFLEGEIRRFDRILRKVEAQYVDPVSKVKLEELKAEARKQIKRNEYLITKLVRGNDSDDGGIEMVASQEKIH